MIAPSEYAAAVLPALRRCGLPVVLEPGRAIVGHSGALVARVVDTKQNPDGRRFAVLDAGMTELMRPALYGSFHRIVPVQPRDGSRRRRGTSSARSARAATSSRASASCRRSRWATWWPCSTPARTASVMGSNYNRRLLAPEVLVDDGGWTRHPPPPDARRRARARELVKGRTCAGSSSPSKASTRAASRRRPSVLRDRLAGAGPHGPAAVVSRLRHRIRRRDRSRAARRARLRRRRDAAALRRQPLRVEAGDRTRAGARRRSSSATAIWRRASPTARRTGSIAAWLREIQKYLPQPDLTVLLDIAPAGIGARKTADRDKYERDLALLGRVRESYLRQASAPRWLRLDAGRDSRGGGGRRLRGRCASALLTYGVNVLLAQLLLRDL